MRLVHSLVCRKKQCQSIDLSSAAEVGLEPLGKVAAPLLTERSGNNNKIPSCPSGRTKMFYSNKRNLSEISSGWAIKMWLLSGNNRLIYCEGKMNYVVMGFSAE